MVETPGVDSISDEALAITQAIEQIYAKSNRMFEQTITNYEQFKESVSKKLLGICQSIDELKAMFIEFEEAEKKKIQF